MNNLEQTISSTITVGNSIGIVIYNLVCWLVMVRIKEKNDPLFLKLVANLLSFNSMDDCAEVFMFISQLHFGNKGE